MASRLHAPDPALLPRRATLYDDHEPQGVEPIYAFATPAGMVEELGLDDDLLARVRNLYAAEVNFADAWIGRLLDKLDDLALDRTTTVLS